MMMTNPPYHSMAALGMLLLVVAYARGCTDANSIESVRVSLMNTDTYQYPTVGGDEDGASLSTQAKHYRVSEIRRDAGTHWVAVYVYQALPTFVGSDYAEIKILTGSDGASPPTHTKTVRFYFDIHNR